MAQGRPGTTPLMLKDGIWQTEEAAEISYPREASDEYFEIEETSFWFRHRNDCILEMVRRFPPNGTLYDVGGGNGVVAANLERNGFPAVLVEPNMAGAVNARKRGLRTVICATIDRSNLDKGSLDAVGIFDLLEHIEDDGAFLLDLQEYLRPAGRLYLTVPAYGSLWSADDDYAGHFRRYALPSVERLLEQTGFHVEYGTHLFGPLPPLIFVFKSLPYKLGLTKKRPATASRDHDRKSRLLDAILARELSAIRRGRRLPAGSSCLVVARRRGG